MLEVFGEIFEADDADISITNAFAFSMDTLFLLLDAHSEDEGLEACALIKVNLTGPAPDFEVIDEFDRGALAYHAWSPDHHFVMTSGGYLHEYINGESHHHDFLDSCFLSSITPISETAILVLGEDGKCFRFENGNHEKIDTGTEEFLYASHFLRPDLGYLGGNYAIFLKWDGDKFNVIELGGNEFIKAIYCKNERSVLIGGDDGIGIIVSGDEAEIIEPNSADIYAITEFKGVEYWGDDEFGILMRDGLKFVPKFETRYAFNLNSNSKVMAVNAGYDAYVFDGENWLRVVVSPDADRLIERAQVQFAT